MTNKQVAIQVIERLQEHGFEALLAGGCVRDMLLGRTAKDYDVATSARPEQVIALFARTLQVGAKFGVVIVMMAGRQVEVATFRSEAGYADGRHPTQVRFVTAGEDAGRRDFTINGMFYDPLHDKVIDYVEGRRDLQERIVRTIGDPDERFGEDYLRMLRAVRFATQLGFAIEDRSWQAVRRHAGKITSTSGERISTELEGILVHPNRAAGARMLFESGLATAIFPRLSPAEADVTVSVLARLRRQVDYPLALAALFCGCRTELALTQIRILKLSRNQTKHIRFLLDHRAGLLNDRMSLAQLKKFLAGPYFWDLYELERAIQKAAAGTGNLRLLSRLRRRIRDLRGVEVKPRPLLNGHDLIRLGAVPGPILGRLAEEMYIAQLEGILQTPQQAQIWVTNWLKTRKSNQ